MSKKKVTKIKFATLLKTLLIFVGAYVAIGALAVYFSPVTGDLYQNRLVKKTLKIIPYPATLFAGKSISVEDLRFRLESVKRFYENQDFSEVGMRVDFKNTEGQKRLKLKEKNILEKLIDDSIIESEAINRGIRVTQEMIDQEVDRKLKEYGAEETLKSNLEKLYGWNEDDFKKNIVKPDLYKEKLTLYFLDNDFGESKNKEKIELALKDLKNGASWESVAKKYSEGESGSKGGGLGWFSLDQMVPEVAFEINEKKKGFESEVIRSVFGYHIVRIDDTKKEGEIQMYNLSQIFVKTKTFPEWLMETRKKYNILIPLREFLWNREKGEVDFLNVEMENFEKDILKKPIDDPSLIF